MLYMYYSWPIPQTPTARMGVAAAKPTRWNNTINWNGKRTSQEARMASPLGRTLDGRRVAPRIGSGRTQSFMQPARDIVNRPEGR